MNNDRGIVTFIAMVPG